MGLNGFDESTPSAPKPARPGAANSPPGRRRPAAMCRSIRGPAIATTRRVDAPPHSFAPLNAMESPPVRNTTPVAATVARMATDQGRVAR